MMYKKKFNFCYNPDQELKKSENNIIMYSPSITCGVSIMDLKIDNIFCYFTDGSIDFYSMAQ